MKMSRSAFFWVLVLALSVASGVTIYTYANQAMPVGTEVVYADKTPGRVAGVETAETVVTVTVDFGDDAPRTFTSDNAKENTALEHTVQTLVDNNIPFELNTSSFGTLLQSVDGRVNGTDGKFWTYTVNGEFATVGAAEYQVKSGDTVAWSFSNGQ